MREIEKLFQKCTYDSNSNANVETPCVKLMQSFTNIKKSKGKNKSWSLSEYKKRKECNDMMLTNHMRMTGYVEVKERKSENKYSRMEIKKQKHNIVNDHSVDS